MPNIIIFNPPNLAELAVFSYENYKSKGKGYIFITPNDDEENGFTYEYVSGEEARKIAAEPIQEYVPEKEILFVILQPDGSLGYDIKRFYSKVGTPEYEYTMRETLKNFGKAPQDD
jgi:hypothetical protein